MRIIVCTRGNESARARTSMSAIILRSSAPRSSGACTVVRLALAKSCTPMLVLVRAAGTVHSAPLFGFATCTPPEAG